MNYDICIVGGLGHIGLPLGLAFAEAGKNVVAYDINRATIDMVSAGKMPFMEKGAEEVLSKVLNKNLFISAEKEVLSRSHFIIIVIGTPVDEHLNPNFTLFKKLFSTILDFINDDQHIILRSTIFPGTTGNVRDFLTENGKKTKVTFCPERIAEGKAMEELRSLPQIIGAFDEQSFNEAQELFLSLTKEIIFLSPIEAELVKLFTNAWRYIQFSISNQFYQIATQNGLDFYKIYDAAVYKYPRLNGFSKAGFAAGPCLFKDTMQLAAFNNNNFYLGHTAMLINEGLPNFIVQRLKERYGIKEKVIGILGMAFKGDNDDPRESLSYKLKKIFLIEAKQVLCTDPYVEDENLLEPDEVISRADIVVIAAPHTVYREISIDLSSKIVIDIWNFFGKGGLF